MKNSHELREKAEKIFAQKEQIKDKQYVANLEKLLEEINIQQIELELQNDELQEKNRLLIEKEKKYQDLYLFSPVAYFTINHTGNIYDINHQAAELFKKPIYAFNRTSIFPYLDEKSKFQFSKFLKSVFEGKISNSVELNIVIFEADIVPTKFIVQKYFDDNFNEELCRCAVVEITKQKKVEEKLSENEIRLKNAEILAKMGNFEIDFVRNKTTWSAQVFRIFGLDPENDLPPNQENYLRFIHPKDVKKLLATQKKCLVNREKFDLEYRIITKQGEKKHVHGFGEFAYDDENMPVKFFGVIQDVTEQKNSQVRLKLLSEIVEQSPSIIMMTDLNGIIWYVNKAFEKTTGYSINEAVGKHSSIVKSDRTPPETYKSLWKKLNQNKVWQGEFINRKKNGELYYESALLAPLFDEKNNKTGYFAIKNDITKQKNAEIELINSQKKLDLILNSFDEPVYVVNQDYEFIFVNNAMRKQFGKDILSKYCHKMIFDNDEICEFCHYKNLTPENRVHKTEMYFEKTNRYNQVTNILLEDNNKLTIYHDITDIKKAQKELKENEQRYIAIFEQTRNPIVVIDQKGFIRQFNKAAYEELGYTKEEYAKLHISQIDPDDSPEEVKERIKQIEKFGSMTFEKIHRKKNGDKINVIVVASFITIKGEKFTLATFNNVTPIREAEKEIKDYSHKLKEAQKLAQMGNWEFDFINNT